MEQHVGSNTPNEAAASTEISPETGAGGFILPNDRVDVLLTRRLKNADQGAGAQDIVTSEIILANVRVLGHRPDAEGEERAESRCRQDRRRSN